MEIILIIGGVLLIVLIYTTINLMKKNEKLEEIISNQQIYIDNLSDTIEKADEKLKEIDEKDTFKSDDEIGWFFKSILYIQETLNNFKLEFNEEQTKR